MAEVSGAAVAPRAEASQALFTKLTPGPGRSAEEVAGHQRARIHSAMVEAVAEHGYCSVTVRELARLSGVSTRAFYQHYSGKEECFLRTHELVVRRLARRLVAAQTEESGWRGRLRRFFEAFLLEIDRDPRAARLMLVDAYVAVPGALDQARRAERTFEMRLAEGIDGVGGSAAASPLLLKGIVAGMVTVGRARLAGDRDEEPGEIVDGVVEWALSLLAGSPAGGEVTRVAATPAARSVVPPPADNRSLILSSVAKLLLRDGYCNLSVARICTVAGVPRVAFKANFADVEDCLAAAVEYYMGEAIAHATAAWQLARSREDGALIAMSAVCERIDTDPALAELCLLEILTASPAARQRNERLAASMVGLAAGGEVPLKAPRPLALEASSGAIWRLLRHRAERGAARRDLHPVALATFALASSDQAAPA